MDDAGLLTVAEVAQLAANAIVRARAYVAARDAYICVQEGVMGGRPVIRGTRVTASALHDRLADGESIADLHEDYPDIPPEAVEAARIYVAARAPGGQPEQDSRAA